MADGVYRGVKRDIGVKSLRLVVASRELSRCVTSLQLEFAIRRLQIIQVSPSRRPTTLLTLDPTPSGAQKPSETNSGIGPSGDGEAPTPYAITSVAWAPSCGRSYHLLATGGRDGHVRIWRVKPAEDNDDSEGEGEPRWTGTIVADFDHHKFVYLHCFSQRAHVDYPLQVSGWSGRMEYNGVRLLTDFTFSSY